MAALVFLWGGTLPVQAETNPSYVYDEAGLLTAQEVVELNQLAGKLGEERSTEFIIITLNGTGGKDIVKYVQDFYDEHAPGYDQPYGNTAILAIDMLERDIYLAGFKKAETYLNDQRLDRIRDSITQDLSAGRYYEAFSDFITLAHDYMGREPEVSPPNRGEPGGYPGVNPGSPYREYESEIDPDNLLFQWWFQLLVSVAVGAGVVGIMAYWSGGRVTVNANTYMDRGKSQVLNQHDNFVNRTVTRRKIPKNESSGRGGGGFGGGGGITGGGHSHSGSRGKF